MQRAVEALFEQVDGAILAAAPADYRAKEVAAQKIKRGAASRSIELVENPDIAAGLGRHKGRRLLVVFAMETEKGPERAREKLARKGGDLIVLNMLNDEGGWFRRRHQSRDPDRRRRPRGSPAPVEQIRSRRPHPRLGADAAGSGRLTRT